jgi:DNA replication protein DnaC
MNLSPTNQRIKLLASSMKLSSFREYDQILREAIGHQKSYEDFLLMLLEQEAISRSTNRLQRLKRAAKFPFEKTLEGFDTSRLQHVPQALITTLASCDFVSKKENIIMIGNPGTGKSHLSIALGLIACSKENKVFFTTAANLSNKLTEAQNDNNLGKLMKSLAKLDLLVLDELSYLSFNRSQSELLFQVISERSERGSIIISTNLEFSKWEEFFPDTMLTNALIDRVTFNAHILNMNGESYRLNKSTS